MAKLMYREIVRHFVKRYGLDETDIIELDGSTLFGSLDDSDNGNNKKRDVENENEWRNCYINGDKEVDWNPHFHANYSTKARLCPKGVPGTFANSRPHPGHHKDGATMD